MTHSPLRDELGSGEVNVLRPTKLSQFIGQDRIKDNLKIFIDSSKKRGVPLDHVIFYGPPGLGKTTLAHISAQELGVSIKLSSGPMLSKAGDIAAILANLQERDILFIDEIHRLPASVEEVLYTAMEDYMVDVVIGEGVTAKSIQINLPKFTLIGATTRLGALTAPFRDRFGIPVELRFYNESELVQLLKRDANILKINISDKAAEVIASLSRGTPRIAIRLLKRALDFATVEGITEIDLNVVKTMMSQLGIDSLGLDQSDIRYMKFIRDNSPVGADTISVALSIDKTTIEDNIEPYLMQLSFVLRTSRGRILTKESLIYLNDKY